MVKPGLFGQQVRQNQISERQTLSRTQAQSQTAGSSGRARKHMLGLFSTPTDCNPKPVFSFWNDPVWKPGILFDLAKIE
jgi:hypothetical protein